MRRFFLVVGAFIFATASSCTLFMGLGYADSIDNSDGGVVDGDSGDDAEYEAIRQASVEKIEAYQTTATDEELNNKNTNADQKAEVLAAYELLRTEDQAPYAEFIARIRRGGIPVLTYVGPAEFGNPEEIDYYNIVEAFDNEDGDITLNADNTQYELAADESTENITHNLKYRVQDSDGNIGELTQGITIKTTPDDGNDQDPGEGDPGDNPGGPTNPDDQQPEQPGDQNPDNPNNPTTPDNPDDNNPDDTNPDDKDPDDGNNPDGDKEPGDSDKPNGSDKPPVTDGGVDNNGDSGSSDNTSKFPTRLPSTGPSDFFTSPITWSITIGLFVALTVFCLTKKKTFAYELV